jgi:hypothetical protein
MHSIGATQFQRPAKIRSEDTMIKLWFGKRIADSVYAVSRKLWRYTYFACVAGVVVEMLTLLEIVDPTYGVWLCLFLMLPNLVIIVSFMQVQLLGFLLWEQFEPWPV